MSEGDDSGDQAPPAAPTPAELQLDEARREIARLKAENRAIRETLSWRITAPLRAVRTALGGGRPRALPARPAGGPSADAPRKDLCILLHLYYPELWPELRPAVENAAGLDTDLFVNLVDDTWTPQVVEEIREVVPDARIYVSPNRGLDVGGYFQLLRVVDLDAYVAVVLLHGKKSPQLTPFRAAQWRREMTEAVLGSPERARENVRLFRDDPGVGIIGSAEHRDRSIGANGPTYERLLDRLGVRGANRRCDYVSGTIMMVRAEVMKVVYEPLKDLPFEDQATLTPEQRKDGQLAHAVERVFAAVARQTGHRIVWR